MELFALGEGTKFGWNDTKTDDVDDAYHNGRVCSSGFSYRSGNNEGTCAAMNLIQQGIPGLPQATVAAPYECDYT